MFEQMLATPANIPFQLYTGTDLKDKRKDMKW